MGFGPCLCGDTCCPSCGPAQGNWRCGICGQWASEGCLHISEETGDYKTEWKAVAEANAKAEAEAEATYFEELEHYGAIAEAQRKGSPIQVACPLGPECRICREDRKEEP